MRQATRLFGVLALVGAGCGGGDDGGGPPDAGGPLTVRVAMANNTPVASFWAYGGDETPDEFDIKLISVRLVHSDTPDEPLVYLHPDCGSEDGCGLAAGPGVTDLVADYLPLMQPTADLNAALAAGEYEVEPGRYQGIVIRWSRDGSDAPTARYRMDAWQAGAEVEFVWNELPTQAFVSTSAFELPAGGDVTVTLAFNLENLILTNQSIDGCEPTGSPSCYSEGTDRWFVLGLPEFGVSVD